jgi:hypothetical protein
MKKLILVVELIERAEEAGDISKNAKWIERW